jgi:uncharacterized protein YlxP (DUF503 family)
MKKYQMSIAMLEYRDVVRPSAIAIVVVLAKEAALAS